MKINIEKHILKNGLTVIVHTDWSTPLVAVNLLYNIGSKHENPAMTGFAHLFEHLMFGGTRAVRDFDNHLQIAGGESNAFTNCDFTNYYITIPAGNIETALWLESDRMNGPDLSENTIAVQKKVVAEEFRQRYLNQPYGEALLNLRPIVYTTHPYRWPTIGMDISHIEKADNHTVREFFNNHYAPDNAILTIAGSIKPEKAFRLAEKWFGTIERKNVKLPDLPREPLRTTPAMLSVERDVPADAVYKAWVIPERSNPDFYIFDVITDILSGGDSGRLYASLVREKRLFSDINAFVTGETDRGMLMITGRINEGVRHETAGQALVREIDMLRTNPVPDKELMKVKNRFESSFHLSNTGVLPKATALSLFELIDEASAINSEVERYSSVSSGMILDAASEVMSENSASTLWYLKMNR